MLEKRGGTTYPAKRGSNSKPPTQSKKKPEPKADPKADPKAEAKAAGEAPVIPSAAPVKERTAKPPSTGPPKQRNRKPIKTMCFGDGWELIKQAKDVHLDEDAPNIDFDVSEDTIFTMGVVTGLPREKVTVSESFTSRTSV